MKEIGEPSGKKLGGCLRTLTSGWHWDPAFLFLFHGSDQTEQGSERARLQYQQALLCPAGGIAFSRIWNGTRSDVGAIGHFRLQEITSDWKLHFFIKDLLRRKWTFYHSSIIWRAAIKYLKIQGTISTLVGVESLLPLLSFTTQKLLKSVRLLKKL